jgi:hypothetical protein
LGVEDGAAESWPRGPVAAEDVCSGAGDGVASGDSEEGLTVLDGSENII